MVELNVSDWVQKLKNEPYRQSHLFEGVTKDSDVRDIVEQIIHADQNYPGGLLNYIQRARDLLALSRDETNPYEGFVPKMPKVVAPEVGSPEFWDIESVGISLLGSCGFVLVAGGLGERLGHNDIKVGLPVEIFTETSYLRLYIEYILSFQRIVHEQSGKDVKLPFAIMVSEDTGSRTKLLLEQNQYFGMDESQIFILQQEKVPALIDNDARIAVCQDNKIMIDMKPHGHGDVHTLLHQNDLPSKWLSKGIRYIFFFQDTNSLSMRALPTLLGASEKNKFCLNSLCCPRMPGEASGAICLLEKDDGHKLTINVEYNVLGPLLKSAGFGGDVPLPGRTHSVFPGNCNCLLFELESYKDILRETGGAVPEFVNPKYADPTKTKFKKPTRVECMMQEFARLYKPDQSVGCTELPRWFCFSVVKNSSNDAIEKLKFSQPADCCFSGEAEYFESNVKCFEVVAQNLGLKPFFGQAEILTFKDLSIPVGPRLVIKPRFAATMTELKQRLSLCRRFSMTTKSVCVLDGPVVLEELTLEGAAFLRTDVEKVVNQNIENEGASYVDCGECGEDDVNPLMRIRGYTVDRRSIFML